ncbi:hypothetical protein [Brucella gallinifaecis]|uniref:hypothetical protein n=1 Tax=Brucella gallinifaecis TaxID=215590 RepID=UPI0023628298|nr:hypothetical protein [Brucella gallinifaecis]
MKIILKTLITTTALAASLSLASAKSTDGYSSAGINNTDFKQAVSAITKDKVCDLDMKRTAFLHIEKVSVEADVPVSDLLILANRRSDKIIGSWKNVEGVPAIEKFICSQDIKELSRFGSFATSRVSVESSDRAAVSEQSDRLRDLVIKHRALKAAERAGCFSDERAYNAGIVSANFNKQIKDAAFDSYRITYSVWKNEELQKVKKQAYGELDTCTLADRLLSKRR